MLKRKTAFVAYFSLAGFLLLGMAGCSTDSPEKEVPKEEKAEVQKDKVIEKIAKYLGDNGLQGKVTSLYKEDNSYILFVIPGTLEGMKEEVEKMNKEFSETKLVFKEKETDTSAAQGKEKITAFVEKTKEHAVALAENGFQIKSIKYNLENDKISLEVADSKKEGNEPSQEPKEELVKKISEIMKIDASSIEIK